MLNLSQHRLYITEVRHPGMTAADWKNIQTIQKKGLYQINIPDHDTEWKPPLQRSLNHWFLVPVSQSN
jgi:hypothetical protein